MTDLLPRGFHGDKRKVGKTGAALRKMNSGMGRGQARRAPHLPCSLGSVVLHLRLWYQSDHGLSHFGRLRAA